jgi:phage shock protein A
MASKKKVTIPKFKVLTRLSERAVAEVVKLFRRTKAGTITKEELNAGLQKVEEPLKQMLNYIDGTLDDLARLKRDQTKTFATKELKIQLKEIGKRVKRMANWSNDW